MTEFLIYDLKVAVLIAAFYFCYRLLMERDTWYHLNRMVLLVTIALSLVLPLCVITLHQTVWIEPMTVVDKPGLVVTELGTVSPPAMAMPRWQLVLAVVLIAGIATRLAFLLLAYLRLRRLLRSGERQQLTDGTQLVVVDEPLAPFSWQHTIVVNRQDYAERNPLLLIHERSHVRLHHSRDIVFVELITALQWFNPVVWLLRRDLRTVHEFEADEAVLSHGADTAQYITLLMQKATGMQACALANGINNSETKKRIDMMIKKKSHPLCRLKGLYMFAVAAATMTLTAKTVTDYRTLPTDKKAETPAPSATAALQPTAVERQKPLAQKEPEKKEDAKPFALHVLLDEFGRITGLSYEGTPDPRRPETFPVGYVFIDDREATAEEVANYKALWSKAETFEMIHRPNEAGDPKYGYKDKQGILVFHSKKQEPQPEIDVVFDICENMPQFPGGDTELMKFVAKNVKYPKAAEEWGVQGRIIVTFVVEKDGSITSAQVAKTTDLDEPSDIAVVAYRKDMTEEQRREADVQDAGVKAGAQALKDEAVRVIKLMPKWQPGKQNGSVVRCNYSIPVTFRLQ